MAKSLKTIDAGGLCVEAVYDRKNRKDSPEQRAAKQKTSSEALRRMNQIYSYQKLELLLSTNFPTAGSALVITLTYDDAHMPSSRRQALRQLKNFRDKMKRAREAAGLPELVAFWCCEVLTAADGRWHFHLVINNTGQDAYMIRQCWQYGQDIEIDKLRIDLEKNWESLARYLSKEPRECQDELAKPGQHAWSCTRNVKRPQVDVCTVPDDYELKPPTGCTVLLDEKKRTEFASYHIVKYQVGSVRAGRRSARARRRRRSFY